MFSIASVAKGLPTAALVPDLERALRDRSRAVVEAPPGSGKTTVVPPVVANERGRIIVTQPRRIAARAAAGRLATLTNTRLGEEIGYSVRGESKRGAKTRIEFVTAGLLLRRLLTDPALTGVDAVVMDEVHERDLDADLTFGILGEVAQLRDDFALVAMSATLDADRWAQLLGDAPVVRVPAVPHPLEITYAPMRGSRLDERGVKPEFLSHVARTTALELDRLHEGSALVFVPGGWEVSRVVAELESLGVPALPLTGSLTAAEQDAALTPGARRAIVATSVAESSLTVPDVRLVVDSGLSRVPRLDAEHGISGLVTVPVSRASGDQRAGRAARTGPGTAVRCVAEHEWAAFPAHSQPEILSADLTQAALTLAAWGAPGGTDLALPDLPAPAAIAQAHATLTALGAVEESAGRVSITPLGRRLARIPAHPRLGRALLAGSEVLGRQRASELVAAVETTERAPQSDLAALVRDRRRGGSPASRRWRQDTKRLAALVDESEITEPLTDDEALALIVALAYPERLARARGKTGDYLLASGTGASLPKGSSLIGSEWLAIADLAHTSRGTQIRAAIPIGRDAALEYAIELVDERVETKWLDGRVRAQRVRALGAIELSSVPVQPDAETARLGVATHLRQTGLDELHWSAAADSLRRRLAFLYRTVGPPWPEVGDHALLERLDEWLGPELDAIARGTPASRIDLTDPLRRILPWPEATKLDDLVPERLEVPTGSRIRVDYPAVGDDRPPVLAVKLQECFGMLDTPRIVGGNVSVLLHLLSPARQPLAVTDDLKSFWSGPYGQVRAEMRGRYPKHPWPENPFTAAPARGTKRSGR